MKLAIAVCTYRRPDGIARLFDALESCEVPDDVDVSFIVVDNHGDLQVPPAPQGWPISAVVEGEQGIPFARNRAVLLARELKADAVAFFDDDEQPRPDCLVELRRVWAVSNRAVVQGGSMPTFIEKPPAWVVDGGYFQRDMPDTESEIEPFQARTSNVMIPIELFDVVDPPFDVRLRFTGGSDTYLFRTAAQHGHRFVAAPLAIVDELVPPSRVSVRWLWRRQYRVGWGRSYHLRSAQPSFGRRLKRCVAGLASVLKSPFVLGSHLTSPRLGFVEAGRSVAYGAGLIVGLVGPRPSEYKDVHGS
ncbi:glycosyltransferase family 2 protein [Acidimicrobiaceae bacterium AH-315-P05]|nr:glycosyltransferase family 2 protein [Acidimicrobiaceae bacterium AH-315-P05]